jgi:hypothetical protein
MHTLKRCWTWFTRPCDYCAMRLYFGSRLDTVHGIYCSPLCYQMGRIMALSPRNPRKSPVQHG